MRPFLPALLLVATPAIAGPYDQPYATIESGGRSEVRKEASVAISKIDGKTPRSPRKSDALAPGRHVVTVRFESGRGMFRPQSQDVEIDVEGCRRYFVVATYQSQTGGEWKPTVWAEPIGECEKRFGKGGPK